MTYKMTATCGGCTETWSLKAAAHCAAEGCHRTFSSVALFDAHRDATGEHGACKDPATVTNKAGDRVLFFRGGMWRGPEIADEDKWWEKAA